MAGGPWWAIAVVDGGEVIGLPRPERPIDPDGAAVERFAADLRQLRDKAGRPGYRQLARVAHYSATTLSDAAGGRRLPTLAVTLAFVAACGGDVPEWTARWQAVAGEARPAEPGRAPYRGLMPYEPDDADWFFGRDRVIKEMCERLLDRRFLAVFGPSGSGKSSALRAGLIPALRDGRLLVVMTPGVHPLEELAVRLAGPAGVTAGALVNDLREHPANVRVAIRQALVAHGSPDGLMLVVDQFEETFRLCPDPAERLAFITALVDIATEPDGRALVVLGMRADHYDRCAEYPDLIAVLRDAQMLIGPMTAAELREAVTRPAARAGLTVEGALVSTVVADASGRPGALPLVSHVLLEAWHRRRGVALTLAGYQAAGGVDGAVAQTAERIFRDLDEDARQAVRRVLLRLAALGEPNLGAGRRPVRWTELDALDASTAAVLRMLADARLVVLGTETVELAHEALITAWPRFAGWIDDDRAGLRIQRQLADATEIWLAHDRDPDDLYRGIRLDDAEEWSRRDPARTTGAERQFLATSGAAARHAATARRRRVRSTLVALVAVVAITSILAAWALVERAQARAERDDARSRQLAAQARGQLDVDPEVAVLLAAQARRISPTREADAVLRQAVQDSRVRAVITGHVGPVLAVVYDAGGRDLITAGDDGTVRVAPVADPQRATVFRGHTGAVYGLAAAPDGRHFATAGKDGTVRLWDRRDPARSTVLGSHGKPARNVAFSPDGARLASAGDDGTVRIFALDRRRAPVVLRGHHGPALSVAFSPDGRTLASGGNDRTIRLWPLSATGAGRPRVLLGHTASVEFLTYSPDGRRLASASTDGTARVWPMAGAAAPVVLRGHDGTVEGVAFSPDGEQVATTGNDRTVRLWSAASAVHPRILRGHKGTVWTAAFSPDGRQVASAADDGTVRIWDATLTGTPQVLRGHAGAVWTGAFGADGRHVVTGGHDRSVRVWDTTGRTPPVVFGGNDGEIAAVDISRDGTMVAGGSLAGTLTVWTLGGRRPPVRLRGGEGSVSQVAFSPDNRWIAGSGADGTIRVWPVGGGAPVELTGHRGAVRAVFSADGRRLVSAGWDGTVRVWKWPPAGPPVILRGHQGPVQAATFSPDGRRVVSSGSDGTVRTWPVDGVGTPVTLGTHQGIAWTVAYTRDGRSAVSSGSDGTVRVWPADGGSGPIVFDGFGTSVEAVALAEPDQRFVTMHGDGTVRVWTCPVCGPIDDVAALAARHVTRRGLTVDEQRAFRS